MSDLERHLANAHAILRKTLREVPPEARPNPPWHAGGPLLTCPAADQIRISLWCADVLRDREAKGEAKEIARIDKAVRAFLEAPGIDEKRHAQLEPLGKIGKSDSPRLVCMRRAASGAATYARGKGDLVFTSAAIAVLRTTTELMQTPEPMRARDFLDALDARLMAYELGAAFRERIKREPPAIDRVVFRAADASDKMAHWIARLANGTYGALVKHDGKKGARATWAWTEGNRDDVLASMPDKRFEEATRRVLASPSNEETSRA